MEYADYVIGPMDSICENGMINYLSECQKAAEQLNLSFVEEEEEKYYPGGCYVVDTNVYYNKDLTGTSQEISRPICGQGKYE